MNSAVRQMGDWLRGRAYPSHGWGHKFESCIAHHRKDEAAGNSGLFSFGICETLFQSLKLRVPAFRFRCYRIALLKLRSHPDDADLDMLKSCTNINFHLHDESSSRIVIPAPARGRSSAGRALDWQSRGQGFDSPRLHHCTFQLLGNRKLFCYTGSWRNG